MTHPTLERAHLEAVLVHQAVLRPELADCVDDARLSPAAIALLDVVCDLAHPAARVAAIARATDPYQARLAKRVLALTLEPLAFYSDEGLIGLLNALPRLSASRRDVAV